MTYEQIFSARMVLMRVQRHIAQAGLVGAYGTSWPNIKFTTPGLEEAFFIVERLLCDLEKVFDAKVRKQRSKAKRRALEHRANRQVQL